MVLLVSVAASLVVTARPAAYVQNTSFTPALNGTNAPPLLDASTVLRVNVPAPVVPIPTSHSSPPAIADQVKLARQRFATLNPQDPDYQNKRDQIFIDLPYSEFSDDFRNGTVARLDRVNERYTSKLKPQTPEDARARYKKAMDDKIKIKSLVGENMIDPTESAEYIGMLDQEINEARAQLGMQAISPTQQPQLAPSPETQKTPSFKEGKIYKQGGKQYRYANGQFVELP